MTKIHDYYWMIASDIWDMSDYHPGIDTRSRPKNAFCKRCGEVLDEWYPRHLEGWLRRPLHAITLPLTKAPMVHTKLWRQLAPHCPSAVIGPVWVQEGDIDRFTLDWVTVLCPPGEIVHVRGGPPAPGVIGVPMHVCETCNRQRYGNLEPSHLVRCQVPPNRSVFMEHVGHLIVSEPIAREIDWSDFPDFRYERLPVLERPLDGIRLLGDPDWSGTSD